MPYARRRPAGWNPAGLQKADHAWGLPRLRRIHEGCRSSGIPQIDAGSVPQQQLQGLVRLIGSLVNGAVHEWRHPVGIGRPPFGKFVPAREVSHSAIRRLQQITKEWLMQTLSLWSVEKELPDGGFGQGHELPNERAAKPNCGRKAMTRPITCRKDIRNLHLSGCTCTSSKAF